MAVIERGKDLLDSWDGLIFSLSPERADCKMKANQDSSGYTYPPFALSPFSSASGIYCDPARDPQEGTSPTIITIPLRIMSPANSFLCKYLASGILIQNWKLTEKVDVVKAHKATGGLEDACKLEEHNLKKEIKWIILMIN